MLNELIVPPEARTATQADELVRGWIVDERLVCSLQPSYFEETPETWGLFLADMLHHLCDALAVETGRDRAELKTALLAAFQEEVEHPTSDSEGEFLEP